MYEWYQSLVKPSWAPDVAVFGRVWSVLYVIIIVTFGYVFVKIFNKDIPLRIGLPFVLNIVFNLAFTYFQFGLRNNYLALIDILLVMGTLIWAIISIYPYSKVVAVANGPYLIWVGIATALQISITYLNR